MLNKRKLILSPVVVKPAMWRVLEERIIALLKEQLYGPMAAAIKEADGKQVVLRNASKSPLEAAIESGQVVWDGREFRGSYDSHITKDILRLGGKYNRTTKGWSIDRTKLSLKLQEAIRQATAAREVLESEVARVISQISVDKIVAQLEPEKLFEGVARSADQQFRRSVRALTVQPKLSKYVIKQVAAGYTKNLKLTVRGFLKKEIKELRALSKASYLKGSRYESLADLVEKSFGVSARKAKFLARQETHLITAKVREARYAEIGITEYYWVAVAGTTAHPVRPMHRKLSDQSAAGRTFSFSSPPVDDPNGGRHNPGENYNCRCVAKPVVRF